MRKLILCQSGFCAVLVYLIVVGQPAHATVPGTKGQIVYSQGDPNATGFTAQIWVANPDGSHQLQVPLGNPVEFFRQAIWSPDGTKLLISHTARPDNTGQCCLFQPATVGNAKKPGAATRSRPAAHFSAAFRSSNDNHNMTIKASSLPNASELRG
jgi:hypothetical protein